MTEPVLERTALYRLYDAAGALLYVGITNDPGKRFSEHQRLSPWWSLVARRTISWCPHRSAALAAERGAIQNESPVWNVVFNSTPPAVMHEPVSVARQPEKRARIAAAGLSSLPDASVLAIATDYEEAAERLLEERDAKLRAAIDAGRKQADLVRITGYSRETIRQALNPEIRAQVRARRATKRPASSEEKTA